MKVRSYLFLFLPALFISIITTGEIQPPPGAEPTPVLELDFNSPWMRELIARCPHARVEGDVLTVEVPAVPGKPMRETAWVVVPLDLKKLGATGRTIQVRMEATFSNVTEPDKKYLGAKGMLAVTDAATGKTEYPSCLINPGRDNWGDMPWRVTYGAANCPENPGQASFCMGLQNSSGKISFRNVKFYCGSKEPGRLKIRRPAAKLKYTFDWSPLRGVMSPISQYNMKESEFALLDRWGVNVIRWQIFPGRVASQKHLGEFLDREHERLARVLELGRKYDIRIIIDLHPINTNGKHLVGNDEGRRQVMNFWKKTVRRYKGHPALFAYDLLNEPLPYDVEPGGPSIHEQYKALLTAVRQIDPVTPVILWDHSLNDEMIAFIAEKGFVNILFSPHFYQPAELTHQLNLQRKIEPYPNPAKGWDKEFLRREMEQIRHCQQLTGARIYIGEFSCARWVPGADKYLADVISLFEEYGWDWTYHAFREASCWDVEMEGPPDSPRRVADTPRKRVLLAGFARNGKRPVSGDTVRISGPNEITAAGSRFRIPPLESKEVRNEKHTWFPVYDPGKVWYATGTSPEETIFGALQEIRVTSVDGKNVYQEGRDYLVNARDNRLGRAPDSAIRPPVLLSYRYRPQRIDSVIRGRDGKVHYRTGIPRGKMPEPPPLAEGETRLANLYLPVDFTKLTEASLLPVTETVCPAGPPVADHLLPRTMRKLRNGEPLRILAWGDSVTEGGYAGLPAGKRWQEQFVERLKARFPQAKIELLTNGWGGRNSGAFLQAPESDRKHHYPASVLGVKADLILSEFTNDSWISEKDFNARYNRFLKDFRAAGSEWIAIAPHHLIGMNNVDGADPRLYVRLLRDFCRKNDVPLADVSYRFSRLHRQGIPFLTLLTNHYNHPGPRGMAIYADALMALFPEQ